MSQRNKKLEMAVKAIPIPKALVWAQIAGEMVGNMFASKNAIEIAQKGVSMKYLKSVIIYGLDHNGQIQDEITLDFDWSKADDEIMLDLNDERSAIEALDKGFSASVMYARQRFERRGLQTSVRFAFRDEISNDPERYAQVQRELGTVDGRNLDWADGCVSQDVLSIRPGKSKDLLVQFRQAKRRK